MAGHGEVGSGAGVGDQLNDDPTADQWLAAPVLDGKGEQAVLDAVPLADARRPVADGDGDAKRICQELRFTLLQAHAHATAAAAVGGDRQPGRGVIAGGATFAPPAPNGHSDGRTVPVVSPRTARP